MSTRYALEATRTRPPASAIAAAALQVLIGTVTSFGGLYFGLQAGGAWIASATLFAVAWPLWIATAIGLARGSARAREIAVALAAALLAFSTFKIIWIHESASYLVACLGLVLLACLTAAPTRRFTARPGAAGERRGG